MVLINLLYGYFWNNLNNQKFPRHLINVSKQDLSKIQQIDLNCMLKGIKLTQVNSSIGLSKLVSLSKFFSD